MQPGDRLLCSLIGPRAPGYSFKRWPLHVTVIPWFRLDGSSEELAAGLKEAFTSVRPFASTVAGEALLGPRKTRPASLLEPASYPELERLARRYLHKKRAWLVDETTRTRRGYLPHVTYQGDGRLHEGDAVRCDHVYIVEQKGGHKEIAAEISL